MDTNGEVSAPSIRTTASCMPLKVVNFVLSFRVPYLYPYLVYIEMLVLNRIPNHNKSTQSTFSKIIRQTGLSVNKLPVSTASGNYRSLENYIDSNSKQQEI